MCRLIAVLAVVSGVSSAQAPAPASSRADQLFRHARAMIAEKNYVDACPLLEQSHRLEPALGTLLNLADCLENVGQPAAAYRAFTQAAEWAERTGEAKRRDVAVQRAQALKPKLPIVTFAFVEPTPAASFRISNAEDLAVEQPLDPGAYDVTVSAKGRKSVRRHFEVMPGAGSVVVAIPVLEVEAVAAVPAVTPAVEVTPAAPSSLKTPGTALAIVGGAIAVASIAGLAWSGDVLARVQRQQPGGPDASSPTVTRSEYATAQPVYTASVAGAIVGGAVLVTGATLLIIQASRAPVTVGLVVTPQGAAASMGGAF